MSQAVQRKSMLDSLADCYQIDCVCVRVCAWLFVWGSWQGSQSGNQKVPGSISSLGHSGVVVSLRKILYSHCSSLPSYCNRTWWPGANWGSSPPSCVTLMGTWCKLGKQMFNCSCLYMAVEGQGGTLVAHTFTCETWYCLL